MKKFFVKILGNEKTQNIAIPLFSILLSLIVGMIVIGALGKYPLTAYANLLQGSGLLPKPQYSAYQGMLTDFTSFLNMMTPMLFAALAVAVALKAGLFNIGVSGQMLAAGFIATITVGYSTLAAPIAKPLVLLIGIVAGMAVGALIGFLKYRFNINEVVSSIMINYIVQYLTSFFINTRYMDEISRQSLAVSDASRLTIMEVPIGGLRVDIPLCIVLAELVAGVMKFLLDRTRLGFEIKAVGASRNAARYAGINVGKTMVVSMMISGALAGLAGVTYYLGYLQSIQPKVLASTGFDAIAVALLGNSNPVGIIFSSFLITGVTKGSSYMNSASGIETEIGSVITGLILLFSACGAFVRYELKKWKAELEETEGKAEKAGKEAR